MIFEEKILHAPTGSGKTYNIIKRAIALTTTTKTTCVIATSTKDLVEQYYIDVNNAYKELKTKNQHFNIPEITIHKITRDSQVDDGLLLELFVLGQGIIITVHNYLRKYDDFANTSCLNALTYLMPSLVHIFIDEANHYIRPSIENLNLLIPKIKTEDSLQECKSLNFKSPLLINSFEDKILDITQKGFVKKKLDGHSVILPNTNTDNVKNLPIKIIYNIENDKYEAQLNNYFLETLDHKTYLINDCIIVQRDKNEKALRFKIPNELNQKANEYISELQAFNSFCRILEVLYNKYSSKEYNSIQKFFNEQIKYVENPSFLYFKEKTVYEKIKEDIIDNYLKTNIYLNNEKKENFLVIFKDYFKLYEKFSRKTKNLFKQITITNANEAFFFNLSCAQEFDITISTTKIQIAEMCFEYELNDQEKNKILKTISIENIKNYYFNKEEEFKKIYINTNSYYEIINLIKKKINKINNKNKYKEIDLNTKFKSIEEDQTNEQFDNNINENYKFDIDSFSLNDQKLITLHDQKTEYLTIPVSDSNLEKKKFLIILNYKSTFNNDPIGINIQFIKSCNIHHRCMSLSFIMVGATIDETGLRGHLINKTLFNKYNNYKIKTIAKKLNLNNRKLEKLYIITSPNPAFIKNKNANFNRNYWQSFTKNFYKKYQKDKPQSERITGFIGFGSQTKCFDFYNLYGMKEYTSFIQGGFYKKK